MPVFDFKLYKGSLRITDNPVGYTPGRGPDMQFTLTYSQSDPNDVAGAGYGNFGPNWSWSGSSWPGFSYVEINTGTGTDAKVYLPGGVIEEYKGTVGPVTAPFDWEIQETPPDEPWPDPEFGRVDVLVPEVTGFTPQANYYSHATLQRTAGSGTWAYVRPAGWPDAETQDLTPYLAVYLPLHAFWINHGTLFRRTPATVYQRVHPDGTVEYYDLKVGSKYLLSHITYRNGSTIQVAFTAGTGRVSDVYDSTGVTTDFTYVNAMSNLRI